MPMSRNNLDSLGWRNEWKVVLPQAWRRKEGEKMICTTAVVICDLCYNRFGPTFFSEYHAQCWVEDRDEDYQEYGQFADGVPRFSTIFHKSGSKIICKRCTEIEIAKTKGKS